MCQIVKGFQATKIIVPHMVYIFFMGTA